MREEEGRKGGMEGEDDGRGGGGGSDRPGNCEVRPKPVIFMGIWHPHAKLASTGLIITALPKYNSDKKICRCLQTPAHHKK